MRPSYHGLLARFAFAFAKSTMDSYLHCVCGSGSLYLLLTVLQPPHHLPVCGIPVRAYKSELC